MRSLLTMLLLLLATLTWLPVQADENDHFFELYDIQGSLFRLRQVAGEEGVKLVAVDFFWDGCGPCKKALPKWQKLHEKYSSKGLRVVVVDVRAGDGLPEARKKLKEYFKAHPVPFPVVFDKYNMVAKSYGVVADDNSVTLPQVFLLEPSGKLVQKTPRCDDAAETIEKTFGSADAP